MNDWKKYVDEYGNFQLPKYIYKTINDLMKLTLDMGTLLSDDKNKLRAYKEQIKKEFKQRWYSIAESLEEFDIVIACVCEENSFCKECGGSRYKLSAALSPDQMQEIGFAFSSPEPDSDLEEKLAQGLKKALDRANG